MKRLTGLFALVLASGLFAMAMAQAQPPAPGGAAAPQAPRAPSRGETLFKTRCASCHEPAMDRTPDRTAMSGMLPDHVMRTLMKGAMQPMAAGLNQADIIEISTYVTGRAPKPFGDTSKEGQNACPANARFNPRGPAWNGWSLDGENTRRAASPGFTAAQVPQLKVKWAFAIEGSRYGQPSVMGNRVFVASASGRVYSLDAKTGCVDWFFEADNGVRTAPKLVRNNRAPSGWAVYVGGYDRRYYALDAASGAKLWSTEIETHPRTVLTGAPAEHNGVIFAPVSSWEESNSGVAAYGCCTFRGSLVALDARTGKVLWKTFMVKDAPRLQGRNNGGGTPMWGPAGSAIWSAPTIDAKRGLVYVTTGDSYTDVEDGGSSDALVALDMKTGAVRWMTQVTDNDNYVNGCSPRGGPVNCPLKVGPDHDFGASAMIVRQGGREVIVAGQKSGIVHGFDPDTGKILWQTRAGTGGALGGVEWGTAADGDVVFAGTAAGAFVTAMDAFSGKPLWQHRNENPTCAWAARCGGGYSAAMSAIPGVLFAPSADGHLRAFESRTGRIVWDFDTAGQKYDTVNGVKGQRGGQLDGTGPTIAGGMLYMISGYNGSGGGGWSDNVLLAFSVDGK